MRHHLPSALPLLFCALIAALWGAPCASAATANSLPCSIAGLVVDGPHKKTWTLGDKQLAWLKKFEELANKIPGCKEAKIEATATGSFTNGFECCPDEKDPTPYTDFDAKGKAEAVLDVGVGKLFNFNFNVPDYHGFKMNGFAKIGGYFGVKGEIEGVVEFKGHASKCACASVSYDAKGSLGGHVTASGAVSFNVTLPNFFGGTPQPHGFTVGLEEVDVAAPVVTTINGKYIFKGDGEDCEPEALKFCMGPLELRLQGKIDIPFYGPYELDLKTEPWKWISDSDSALCFDL